MIKPSLMLALVLATGGAGATAYEINRMTGDGATDEHVVREPVRAVVIQAEDGDVRLERRAAGVHVRVHRDHRINTPETSETLVDGVLTLETDCVLGFLSCSSDYRVAVPPGVTVTVDKPSGRLDAGALGAGVVELDGEPVTVTAPGA